MFKLAPNAADSAAALAAELRRRGIAEVSMLHSDDDYGREGLTALRERVRQGQDQAVRAEAVRTTDTELAAPVGTADRRDPAAPGRIWTPPEQAVLAATAADAGRLPRSLVLDAAAAGDLFLGSSGRATERATLVFTQTMVIDDVIATTPAKAARRQWFQRLHRPVRRLLRPRLVRRRRA